MAGGHSMDRRAFLRGAASTFALSGAGIAFSPSRAAAGIGGQLPYRMAMHVHACFSEGDASMEAQLSQAEATAVDVLWWTEHDHRMVARRYLNSVHFNGLTEYTDDSKVTWRSQLSGDLSASSVTIVTSPVSANDTGDKALRLTATSGAASQGSRRLVAEVRNYGLNTSLDGTTISIDVHPLATGVDSWAEITVQTSYRPAREGRVAGTYSVNYRVGGVYPAGDRQLLDETTALVVVTAPEGTWTTLALDPVTDLNSFWPGVDFRDSALTEFSLAATSKDQSPATVVFDALTFQRIRRELDQVVQTQQELMDWYAPQFPAVTQHRAMEMSENTPHLNWFGNPAIWLGDDPANTDVGLAVSSIHEAGGVVSYNHPYGSSGGVYSATQRTNKRRALTTTLVNERVFGADMLEVGYLGGRAGMRLADYVALWDVLSRNAIFTTGSGTSDDHNGRDWASLQWRCVTGVWAADSSLESLQGALTAGRAWFGDLAAYNGTINLLANGYVGMGGVAIIDVDRCPFDIEVTSLPVDWSIVLVSGDVDEAGDVAPDPNVTRRTFMATELVDSLLSIKVNTSRSRFFRIELRDGGNVSRAFSNPIWLLRQPPVFGIPAVREAIAPPPIGPP